MTTWAPGQYPRGADLEELEDQVDALTAPGVVDFSSGYQIVGSTSNPSHGNSTLQAQYRRPLNSDIVDCWWKFTIGSTFSAGSGHYEWPLPFPEASPQLGIGSGTIVDLVNAVFTATVISISASRVVIYMNGQGNPVGSGGHGVGAWVTGDYVQAFYRYMAAT